MTIEKYEQSVHENCKQGAAYTLLKRVVSAFEDRKMEVDFINGIGFGTGRTTGETYISVEEISKHNGAKENVSVSIRLYRMTAPTSARLVFSVKVPKDSSEKVINNRIDKIMEAKV